MAQASLKIVEACQEKIVTKTEEIDALRQKLEKLLQKKPKWVNCIWIAEVYFCRFSSQNHLGVVVAAAE